VNLFFPILYLLATVFVTVVPMYASPVETGYGCLMILTSVPVYFMFIAWRNKPKKFQQAMGEYDDVMMSTLCHNHHRLHRKEIFFTLQNKFYRSFNAIFAKIVDGRSWKVAAGLVSFSFFLFLFLLSKLIFKFSLLIN
jgi:hypothetical protein